ncbi:MAG TPA: O-antigen ligase family protein [Acidimicrobiia bacterium]|nr:O-antigen ligase family protein [Acidimicrobiia bacterium]
MNLPTLLSPERLRERHPALAGAIAVCVVAGACGVFGWLAAQLGSKGVVGAAGASVFIAVLILVTRREEVILATAVLSVATILHKAFSGIHDISSGPVAIYLSSFDLMILVLWFTWFVKGPYEMAAELRSALRRPIVWAPVFAAALMLPSIVVAPNVTLAVAELWRMTWMYLLFLYFAAHIKSKAQVWIVLGALGAVGVLEALVVAAQKVTHSSLGLSVFGTPEQLHNRHDQIQSARPFGTMAHPVFMGAFVGAVALVALSVAVNARSTKVRWLWFALSGLAASPIFVSNARSAALGLAVAVFALVIWLMMTHRLSGRIVAAGIVVAALLCIPFSSEISKVWSESFGTAHFSLEWQSRVQLDNLAVKMFEDKPIIGHGLNNFEQVMSHYDTHGLIFTGHPVHNLYLLQLAETGVVGFLGLVLLSLALVVLGFRLARSRDRLYSAVGYGFVAVLLFWGVEELFVFSLRQEHPRALLFMLSGLAVACSRLAGVDRPRPVLHTRLMPLPPRPKPDRSGVPFRARRPSRSNGDGNGNGRGNGHRVIRAVRAALERPEISRAERLARRRAWRRRRFTAGAVGLACVVASVGLAGAGAPVDGSVAGLRVVFSAYDRHTGEQGVYTVNPDGTGLKKITPNDGNTYNWPSWAYNGQRIVFTRRSGPGGSPEQVFLMNPDGTGSLPITDDGIRNAQPHVLADGRSMVFTAFWAEYERVAVYRMDFTTGLVTNLSAVASQAGAFDSDPKLGTDGRIYFIDARGPQQGVNRPGQVAVMNTDGTHRRLITDDGYYNTDPAASPNNDAVAIARYVGQGQPHDENAKDPFQVKLYDFDLIVHDVASGAEQALTQGQKCFLRPAQQPCTPNLGPAYLPQWTPDGNSIGFVSVLSNTRSCICLINRDGSNPRTMFQSDDLAVNWFDWIVPGNAPNNAILNPQPAGALSPRRMIVTGVLTDGKHVVFETAPDRFGGVALPIPDTLEAGDARFSPDRTSVWFDGLAAYNLGNFDPNPPPPPGKHRQRHYTLSWMSQYYVDPPLSRLVSPARQIWSLDLTSLKLIHQTTPWTEDWRDAIPDGENRGAIEPSLSPNGRFVTYTSLSSVDTESSILRIDRKTREVLSLTNATAGALPVEDSQPAWSPDGGRVVFSSRTGDTNQLWMMDAVGYGARQITHDRYLNVMPTFSPDGRSVVYSSYRGKSRIDSGSDPLAIAAEKGKIDLHHWYLVKLDLATGKETVLTRGDQSPAFHPVYDPDGSKIYYIGVSGPPYQTDVWVIDAAGGRGHPLQVTLRTSETSIDIR